MYRRIRMFRFGRIHLHFSLCSEFSTGLLPPIKYILKHLLIGYKKHYFCHVIICQFISAVWLYLTDLCWELTSSWWFESNNGFLHIHIIRKEVNNIFWGVGILFLVLVHVNMVCCHYFSPLGDTYQRVKTSVWLHIAVQTWKTCLSGKALIMLSCRLYENSRRNGIFFLWLCCICVIPVRSKFLR